MSVNIRTEHLRAVLKLAGLSNRTRVRGFEHSPPTRIDRLHHECAFLETIFLKISGNLACCFIGKAIRYSRGLVQVDMSPSVSSILKAALAGEPVVPLKKSSCIEEPFEFLRTELSLDIIAGFTIRIGYNNCLVLFARTHEQDVIVHFPIGDSGKESLARHRQGLLSAQSALRETGLLPLIPTPMHWLQDAAGLATVQSRLQGRQVALMAMSEAEFCHLLYSALDLLLKLPAQNSESVYGPDENLLIEKLYPLADRIPIKHTQIIKYSIRIVKNWKTRAKLKGIFVHGDCWLENMIVAEDDNQIIGLIDWEWCRQAGLPGFDALQLALMSNARRCRIPFSQMIMQLWDSTNRDPWLNDYMVALFEKIGMSEVDLQHVGIVLWLDHLRRGWAETAPEKSNWLDDMVIGPGEAIRQWSATLPIIDSPNGVER